MEMKQKQFFNSKLSSISFSLLFWFCMIIQRINTTTRVVTAYSFVSATSKKGYFYSSSVFSRHHRYYSTQLLSSQKSSSWDNNSDSNNNNNNPVNGEGNNRQAKNQQRSSNSRQPKTGWNHNLPSDDSDFWNGPQETERQRKQQIEQSSSNSENSSSELRTGWLHNTKSKTQKEKQSSSSSSSSSLNLARQRLEMAKLQQERNHRIINPPTIQPAGTDRLIAITEHLISVPVYRSNTDNNNNNNQRIDIYFTIVEKITNEKTRLFYENELKSLKPNQRAIEYVKFANMTNVDTCVLYLQGGPGFGAPTPIVSISINHGSSSWIDAAFNKGYQRIVLMDQRGTGRSTPITKQTLQIQYPNLFLLDDDDVTINNKKTISDFEVDEPEKVQLVKQAINDVTEYMIQFRADNIIYDAEYIREALIVPPNLDNNNNKNDIEQQQEPHPWGCSLGQSFGGFCQMTYLSLITNPPKIMLFTGGIAPMLSSIDDVYSSLWDRVYDRNMLYYDMYPSDIQLVKIIVKKLIQSPELLPSGGQLTARRFLQLGLSLGGSPSSFASLHNLISTAFVNGNMIDISIDLSDLIFTKAFLKQIDIQQSFDDHPIYFWLHESIYADKNINTPTMWSAHRMYEIKPEFNYKETCNDNTIPTLFFGEHVFPWMVEDYAELNGIGLKEVANAIATKNDWTKLYDTEMIQQNLQTNTRAAAAVYHDDMYVDYNACMKVTNERNISPMKNCKLYITNEYQHSGLRDDGGTIFTKLHGIATGNLRIPS